MHQIKRKGWKYNSVFEGRDGVSPTKRGKEREKKTQIYMCLATTPKKKKNVLGPVPGTLIKII